MGWRRRINDAFKKKEQEERFTKKVKVPADTGGGGRRCVHMALRNFEDMDCAACTYLYTWNDFLLTVFEQWPSSTCEIGRGNQPATLLRAFFRAKCSLWERWVGTTGLMAAFVHRTNETGRESPTLGRWPSFGKRSRER